MRVLVNFIILIIILACALVGSSVMTSLPEPEVTAERAFSPPPEVPASPAPSSSPEQTPEITDAEESEDIPEEDDEPEEDPGPVPEYFTIAMMGDCSLASEHNAKSNAYAYENTVGDDYAYPFSIMKPFYAEADFVIVNLECAICDYNVPADKSFRLRAPPEYVNILVEGGVDCAALGNNHTMDYGQKGYDETRENLSAAGIGYAPDGGWELFTTDSGLIVGVYSKNTVSEDDVKKAVAEMKEAGAELIIMALHWGDEGSYRVADRQKLVGRAAIDAGANIVMGTHPHTLQPVEEYHGGYIYYSLGNWTFGGHTNPRDKDTVLAKVTVMRDIDGTISVVEYENIPCSSSGSKDTNDYRPVPYDVDSEEYNRTLSKLNGTFDGPDLVVSYDNQDPTDSSSDATPSASPSPTPSPTPSPEQPPEQPPESPPEQMPESPPEQPAEQPAESPTQDAPAGQENTTPPTDN